MFDLTYLVKHLGVISCVLLRSPEVQKKTIVLLGSVVRWQINIHSSSSFTDFVLLLHETRIVWVENTIIGELFEIFALRTLPLCRKDGHKLL